jgi:hypothetical protein
MLAPRELGCKDRRFSSTTTLGPLTLAKHSRLLYSFYAKMTTPDGATCYFCLGEEADEEGMPLVRDCSCRGDSAGFVHFSCLVMYAEQKSKQADEGDMDAFTEPWEKCTNCKQPFMGQLSVDVASDFVSFAEATYGK